MDIKNNISLQGYNTFNIAALANSFVEINSEKQLLSLLQEIDLTKEKHLILGGGSNILLTEDFNGLIIKNNLKGIELIETSASKVKLKVGAGEKWHEFVLYCIANEYAGLENLSLIPGSVGASPMQNIGAYGVEVKDYISSVNALRLSDGKPHQFSNSECNFGYRSSIFKTSHKNQFFITSVEFELKKQADFNTSYGAITDQLQKMGVNRNALSLKNISDAVIHIRQSKLPDPMFIGNAGSFFKNPVVSEKQYQTLLQSFPSIAAYPIGNEQVKLAAGWMIENAGWKGFRKDDYGVHQKQALVLVNYGKATGEEIFNLSSQIIEDIKKKFGVELEREVNII